MNKIFLPLAAAMLMMISPLSSLGTSPLRYHTFLVAKVEARVETIRSVYLPGADPAETRERSPRWKGGEVQEIILRSTRIENVELNRTGSPLRAGDSLTVTNQYLDQKPPFADGDTIRVRVRLVLPEERYDAQDPRRQWWFCPPGEPLDGPPRLPFVGVQVIR